jgi:hypothetical protein
MEGGFDGIIVDGAQNSITVNHVEFAGDIEIRVTGDESLILLNRAESARDSNGDCEHNRRLANDFGTGRPARYSERPACGVTGTIAFMPSSCSCHFPKE